MCVASEVISSRVTRHRLDFSGVFTQQSSRGDPGCPLSRSPNHSLYVKAVSGYLNPNNTRADTKGIIKV